MSAKVTPKETIRVIEKDGMFWTAAHKAGDALGLLSEDIGHVQNLYLRSVFPLLIAWMLGAVVVVALGLFSWPCAIMLLIGLVAMAFFMPLLSLLANAARQARANHGSALP